MTTPTVVVFLSITLAVAVTVFVFLCRTSCHHPNPLRTTTTTTTTSSSSALDVTVFCTDKEWVDHPMLCHLLDRSEHDLVNLVHDIHNWANETGLLVDLLTSTTSTTTTTSTVEYHEQKQQQEEQRRTSKQRKKTSTSTTTQIPIVVAHGMGDSCYNTGMENVIQYISKLMNDTYTVCIPIGTTREEDTKNGYLLDMDTSIDIFATGIQNDEYLKDFTIIHAIGFSQGNNIIRGYIQRYNHMKTVHTFLSIDGVNAGIGAVPYCIPHTARPVTGQQPYPEGYNEQQEQQQQQQYSGSDQNERIVATAVLDHPISNYGVSSTSTNHICDFLMEQASHRAYTTFAQQHSFQANYWRDPRSSMRTLYEKYSQLAILNNEVADETKKNHTYNENYILTTLFVWIIADLDEMVWPKEGEQWGSPNSSANDPFSAPILSMKDTEWYQQDLFGLRTADEMNKNKFDSFHGQHMQFTNEDLKRWIQTYLIDSN